jgi:hypothetical protein
MRDEDKTWFYLPAGVAAAIGLGMILVPFRGLTSAGNFIFAFVVLIVVVAEMGGRAAAITTAACSALSLDFFLTRPYLTLSIADKHDVIAFAGLAICGLVAAGFGSGRGRRVAALAAARAELDLLHAAVGALDEPGPAAERIAPVLRRAREALPLAGAAVRDGAGALLAAAGPAFETRPAPAVVLDPVTLLPAGAPPDDLSERAGHGLPVRGARVPLAISGREVGWLDLWGDGRPAGQGSRRTLAAMARLVATMTKR